MKSNPSVSSTPKDGSGNEAYFGHRHRNCKKLASLAEVQHIQCFKENSLSIKPSKPVSVTHKSGVSSKYKCLNISNRKEAVHNFLP